MKKAKNFILLVGLIFNLLYVIFSFVTVIFNAFSKQQNNLLLLIGVNMLSSLLVISISIIPFILLIFNLKNKTGKVLPIISGLISFSVCIITILNAFTIQIPQYLVLNSIGFVEMLIIYITNLFTSGIFLIFIGFATLTVGSIISLIKNKS